MATSDGDDDEEDDDDDEDRWGSGGGEARSRATLPLRCQRRRQPRRPALWRGDWRRWSRGNATVCRRGCTSGGLHAERKRRRGRGYTCEGEGGDDAAGRRIGEEGEGGAATGDSGGGKNTRMERGGSIL
uniref:Uncharacterized protein n=1 Tax=Oryza sativa subsp. japonica TaxID=39947 RepID=Q2QP69_ORYSJ|nr:hypothetical protein LOC_Os12g35510 [Oryza sativa Japonica Group]